MSGSATTTNGVLRSTSTTSMSSYTENAVTDGWWQTSLNGVWSDVLLLGAGSGVASVEFNLLVNGTLSRDYINLNGNRGVSGAAAAYYYFINESGGDMVRDAFDLRYFDPAPETTSFSRTYTFTMQARFNSIFFAHSLESYSRVIAQDPDLFIGPNSGSANFGSSAGITGLRFFDATGSLITEPVQYSFQNGTTLYDPNAAPAPVPEPSTLFLVATGMLVVAGATTRRRAA